MKIVLSGIETNNKGAELMLYAILQQIEQKHPTAEVFIPLHAIAQGLDYVQTSVKLKDKPFAHAKRWAAKIRLGGILRRLHLPWTFCIDTHIVKDAAYFLDASGFAFSDQWSTSKARLALWEENLKGYHTQGTKIVFLPQAFGPIEKKETKELLNLVGHYANWVMPREKISLNYLIGSGIDTQKIRMFSDFTSLVHGTVPQQFKHLEGAVCIIPNMRMIDKGGIKLEFYISTLAKIVRKAEEAGKKAYLLNHEGKDDEKLAFMCKKRLGDKIEVVTRLNALEVKGLISKSYLCITSRFHGVASALNSMVPCLATSWSHKYKELFSDYKLDDCVLNLQNEEEIERKVSSFLDENNNIAIRKHLSIQVPIIQAQTEEMWKLVWAD